LLLAWLAEQHYHYYSGDLEMKIDQFFMQRPYFIDNLNLTP